MDYRKRLEKEVEKQKQKIGELQTQLTSEEAYLRAQLDMLKLFPKEAGEMSDVTLRPGSDPAKVRDMLKEARASMHISDILQRLGKPLTTETRSALSGTLGMYVRRGEIFTRPAPNTFGLLDFSPSNEPGGEEEPEPPDNFG